MADSDPEPRSPSDRPDRRAAPRYRIGPDRASILMALIEADPYPARVRNISTGGISLLVGQPYEPGALLPVQLRNLARNVVRNVQVKVLYALEHPNGDWVVGGEFARKLTGEELQSLL